MERRAGGPRNKAIEGTGLVGREEPEFAGRCNCGSYPDDPETGEAVKPQWLADEGTSRRPVCEPSERRAMYENLATR